MPSGCRLHPHGACVPQQKPIISETYRSVRRGPKSQGTLVVCQVRIPIAARLRAVAVGPGKAKGGQGASAATRQPSTTATFPRRGNPTRLSFCRRQRHAARPPSAAHRGRVATPGARAPEATASVRPHADTPRLLPLRETRWTQRWDPRRPLGSSGTRSRCPTTKSTPLSLPMQRSAKSPSSNCARVKERWHPSPSVSAPP